MSRQSQHEFVTVDPATVVGDADQAGAAGLDLDRDRAGAGVEAVLDQLLDHRRGPLDHFAGRDLVDQMGCEGADLRQDVLRRPTAIPAFPGRG